MEEKVGREKTQKCTEKENMCFKLPSCLRSLCEDVTLGELSLGTFAGMPVCNLINRIFCDYLCLFMAQNSCELRAGVKLKPRILRTEMFFFFLNELLEFSRNQ